MQGTPIPPRPWKTRMPGGSSAHASRLLSLCSRSWEPQLPKPASLKTRHSERSRPREKRTPARVGPLSRARESPHCSRDPVEPTDKYRERTTTRCSYYSTFTLSRVNCLQGSAHSPVQYLCVDVHSKVYSCPHGPGWGVSKP